MTETEDQPTVAEPKRPLSERAVDRTGGVLASHSRRGFLVRTIGLASAFAAGPVRFLLYPEAARAASPSTCAAGTTCHDSGYSTFCCTINGGSNDCPSGTSVAGWWYATVGPGYCSQGNLRYYIDCYSSSCTCTCANDSCGNRRQCCQGGYTNNCSGPDSGNVYCRIVRCARPCDITWPGGITCLCNTVNIDQNTCCHSSGASACTFAAPTCAACGGSQNG
jgi:hypothetical protein